MSATQTKSTRAEAAPKRMNSAALIAAMTALPSKAGPLNIEHKWLTDSGQQLDYWRFSTAPTPKKIVTLVGGIHAREWEPPEGLIAFAALLATIADPSLALASAPSTFGPTYIDARTFDARLGDWLSEMIDFLKVRTKLLNADEYKLIAKADAGRRALQCAALWSKWLKPFFETHELHIIPIVNRSGRDHSLTGTDKMWRGNLNTTHCTRGVDINRNFPLPGKHTKWEFYHEDLLEEFHQQGWVTLGEHWSADQNHQLWPLGKDSKVFGGEPTAAPSSSQTPPPPPQPPAPETEAKLVQQYLGQPHSPQIVIDFHTCGGAIIVPWGCVGTV